MNKNKIFEMAAISNETLETMVQSAVKDWREYINDIITELEKISSKQVQLLCYFSIMESIAQDIAGYPTYNLQKTFTDFILKYQTMYPYLELVNPATLFYHVEEKLNNDVDLSDFEEGQVYNPRDAFLQRKSSSILNALSKSVEKSEADKLANMHRYVDLLYRLRCRLSHEFSSSYISISSQMEEPYCISLTRTYVKGGSIVNDDVWQLCIPVKFVQNICMNCVENYLQECLKNNTLPTSNDSMDRFCELSWYSK